MAKSAPLSDTELMKCIHRHGFYFLFERDGRPHVLRRLISEKKAGDKNCLTEESGDLDGKHLTEVARKIMAKAWDEYITWKTDNK